MNKKSENIRIRNIIDIKNNINNLPKELVLYYSSFFDYKDGIKIAYEQGVEFNNETKISLAHLIRNNDVDSIQMFSTNFTKEIIDYGLIESVDDFNLNLTEYFIKLGGDIKKINYFTLHAIINCGEFKLAKLLLKYGVDFNYLNPKYSINENFNIFKRYMKMNKLYENIN